VGQASPRADVICAHSEISPISVPERVGAVILIGAALIIGLYPRFLLDLIGPGFNSPLFDELRKVGNF